MLPEQSRANRVKEINIIDMGLTFTAMMRIFEVNSKVKIANKLTETLSLISSAKTMSDYLIIHESFCIWFTENIKTAEKNLKNGKLKLSKAASYGHAAKVLDISAKVYFYYAHCPLPEVAKIVTPLLNGAIDTPIMEFLKSNFIHSEISAKTIEEIDKIQYEEMQKLIKSIIKTKYKYNLMAVQFDDIMWNELNR